MSQETETCVRCETETKRSTAIFGKGKEFPKLVDNNIADEEESIVLCYDCYTEVKD